MFGRMIFRTVAGATVRGLQGGMVPPGVDKFLRKLGFGWFAILIPVAILAIVLSQMNHDSAGNVNPVSHIGDHTYMAPCWNADAHSWGTWQNESNWVCQPN